MVAKLNEENFNIYLIIYLFLGLIIYVTWIQQNSEWLLLQESWILNMAVLFFLISRGLLYFHWKNYSPPPKLQVSNGGLMVIAAGLPSPHSHQREPKSIFFLQNIQNIVELQNQSKVYYAYVEYCKFNVLMWNPLLSGIMNHMASTEAKTLYFVHMQRKGTILLNSLDQG